MALAGTGLELTVRGLSTLRPHEQTIPAHVEQMVHKLEQDGVQKDPILVDRRTGTVLDGMHRLEAFAALGYDRAVCCALDYNSDRVTVERWARVYRTGRREDMQGVVTGEGFSRRLPQETALAALRRGEEGVIVAFDREALAQSKSTGLAQAFRLVERLDSASSARGWKRAFVSEEEMEAELSKPDRVLVLVQELRKEDVLEAAATGKLFPCKTSMHAVDPRPVSVRFPLSELGKATTNSLTHFISGLKPRLLAAGSFYEGRRYKERLLLLNPV